MALDYVQLPKIPLTFLGIRSKNTIFVRAFMSMWKNMVSEYMYNKYWANLDGLFFSFKIF